MADKKFAIGIDFGTKSWRTAVVDISNGHELAMAVHLYANGMIDQRLSDSDKPLPPESTLQDLNDGRGT